MEKLLLITLLSSGVYAQTTVHFYYGTRKALGAEILIDNSLGFGFSGTAEESRALGKFSPGTINEYDKKNFVSRQNQKWFTLYSVIHLFDLKKFQISGDLGVAIHEPTVSFLEPNRNEYYHKKEKAKVYPMVGVNVNFAITENIGWQIGVDTFNHLNTGFVVYF